MPTLPPPRRARARRARHHADRAPRRRRRPPRPCRGLRADDLRPRGAAGYRPEHTLAEPRTLRAKERLPDLRERLSHELHRRVGLIPELKHSTCFRSLGLAPEEPLAGRCATTAREGRDGE